MSLKSYIFTHPRSYEIEKVKDSQVVRAIITAYVRSEMANCRSAVRKAVSSPCFLSRVTHRDAQVFDMVKADFTLKQFARSLSDDYSLPPKPSVFDDDHLAYYALMVCLCFSYYYKF